MPRTMILRFRDLVTEEGGTIKDHTDIINQFGEVWWGWWARKQEITPKLLFRELSDVIQNQGAFTAYLFNAGSGKFYATEIAKIQAAPSPHLIPTPDPEKSPSYYHRAPYPAWFLLRSIEEVDFQEQHFTYDSFPTVPDLHGTLNQLMGLRVSSLEQLRHIDVTLWSIRTEG